MQGSRRVSVAAERLPRWLDGFAERHGVVLAEPGPEVMALTGADGARAWIEVPFPPLDGVDLLAHVRLRRRVGVLLVRRGGHAVGVFDGATLVDSKVGSSYVQGTTKAGGWSQQRYARRRSNQASAAFADAANTAARVLLPAAVEAIVTGGDRSALAAVLEDARLAPLRPLVTGPSLQVPDPRLRVLRAAPDQFLAVRITLDP